MMLNGTKVDVNKLIKCLGMLGSSHDGEVLNAAKACHKLMQGASWDKLLKSNTQDREINILRDHVKHNFAAAMRYKKEAERFEAELIKLKNRGLFKRIVNGKA